MPKVKKLSTMRQAMPMPHTDSNAHAVVFEDLKPAHVRFIQAWWKNGGNATKAYMENYPNAGHRGAMVSASNLLGKPKIKDAISRFIAVMVTPEAVMAGTARLAYGAEKEEIQLRALNRVGTYLKMDVASTKPGEAGGVTVNVNIGLPAETKIIDAEIVE